MLSLISILFLMKSNCMEMSDNIESYLFGFPQGYKQEALLNKVSASVKCGG